MRKRILVVDDEKYIRQGIRNMIERLRPGEYDVQVAKNGAEALSILEQMYCDIVFTDICMPMMDGMAFLHSISMKKPRPTVIIISGYNSFSYAVEGIRNGVADYLLKPIHQEEVEKLLDKYGKRDLDSSSESVYSHELLSSEISRAILDDELPPESAREIAERVYSYLGCREIWVTCLRVHSVFFRAQLKNKLEAEFSERFLLVSELQKWEYAFTPGLPVFAYHAADGQAFTAGAASFSLNGAAFDSLTEVCREAKERAMHAFLTECGLCAEPFIKGNVEFGTEELLWKLRDGAPEAFRAAVEEHWSRSIRECFDGAAFTACIRELLAGIMQIASGTAEKYVDLSRRLLDPYGFSGWNEFKQEVFGYAYLVMTSLREENRAACSQSIRDALSYIESNFACDINLASVANAVNVNYSVLSRDFSQQLGIGFVNYLKKRRVEEAKRLMAETQLSVAEIGSKIGFQNERQYVKVFKEIIGITPNEYRKIHA